MKITSRKRPFLFLCSLPRNYILIPSSTTETPRHLEDNPPTQSSEHIFPLFFALLLCPLNQTSVTLSPSKPFIHKNNFDKITAADFFKITDDDDTKKQGAIYRETTIKPQRPQLPRQKKYGEAVIERLPVVC